MVVFLLVLVFCHAPIPYAHCHEGMTEEQLGLHIIEFHSGNSESDLPEDYHLHFILLDVILGDIPETDFVLIERFPNHVEEISLTGSEWSTAEIYHTLFLAGKHINDFFHVHKYLTNTGPRHVLILMNVCLV